MTETTLYRSLIFIVALPVLAACSGTTTSIPQSYRNPGYETTVFKKLFVIGVAQDQESRKGFEDAFSAAIIALGGQAEASWHSLPQDDQLEEAEIRSAIERGGFDGVVITRLLSVDQDKEYTPATTHMNARTTYYPGAGYGYGYGYYGFYGTTFTQVHDPGYFETSTTVRLETNLYSVADSGLVWSGQSDTVDPKSVADVRESMTAAVATKLKEERLIP